MPQTNDPAPLRQATTSFRSLNEPPKADYAPVVGGDLNWGRLHLPGVKYMPGFTPFRPVRPNGKRQQEHRPMDPDAIDRVVRKFATGLGLDRGYSAHSMRATFITPALANGAQLEDVQKAAGHCDPGTTKLYDRRGYNPEKAASFFATY
jgi:integrase